MTFSPLFRTFLLVGVILSEPATAQITLSNYRERVLDYSRALHEARAQSDEAYASSRLAHSRLWPRLSASGDFSLAMRHREGVKPWSFSLQPELIATLYGEALKSSYDSSKLQWAATEADEVATELEVCYAADYAYWNLSAMGAYRQAMKRYVELIRSLKSVIEHRFTEGYIAKGDVLMIEARLATAEYEALVAEENFEVALHNFNRLQGQTSDCEVELDNSILDSLAPPQRISFEEALDARPDFRAATLRSEAALLGPKIVRAGYLPQLAVGLRGIWSPESPNRRGETRVDGLLFARVSVPLFGWGARRKAVAVSEAAARRQLWQQEQLYDEILLEERNGWSAVVESRARVEAMRQSLRIAGENLDLGTYSYNEGLSTILDVLQTQLDWIQIYTNAITAHFNYAVACSAYARITARSCITR